MKSCAGEEAREPRIKLQRTDICYRELEQERIYLQRSKQRDLQGDPQESMLGSVNFVMLSAPSKLH